MAKGPSGCSHYTAIAALGHTTSKRLSGHFGVEPGDLLAASRMAGNGAKASFARQVGKVRLCPIVFSNGSRDSGSSCH